MKKIICCVQRLKVGFPNIPCRQRNFNSRSFNMLYDSEVDVKGINTYRFVIDPENFAVIDKNLPFCQPDEDNCLPEGLLNVEECYGGCYENEYNI